MGAGAHYSSEVTQPHLNEIATDAAPGRSSASLEPLASAVIPASSRGSRSLFLCPECPPSNSLRNHAHRIRQRPITKIGIRVENFI
jgi:hypothetical protein